MDSQEAIERPRVVQGRVHHTDSDDRLRVERRLPPRVVSALRRRGHPIDLVPDWSGAMGRAHALTVWQEPGGPILAGGADPRGDGLALGY